MAQEAQQEEKLLAARHSRLGAQGREKIGHIIHEGVCILLLNDEEIKGTNAGGSIVPWDE